MHLTKQFEDAFVFTHKLHARQLRRGKKTPYIAHLMSVSALVLEAGGDEEEAIAALLHDAVEDQGGWNTLEEIRSRFGDRVAEIIIGCTDAFTTPKPPWRHRKEIYLENLAVASPSVLLVSLADKLHNARTILVDLHTQGDKVWKRFRGGKKGTLWYYRSLLTVFLARMSDPLVAELERVVRQIEAFSQR